MAGAASLLSCDCDNRSFHLTYVIFPICSLPVLICEISFQGVEAENDLPPSSTGVANLQAADGRPVAEHFQLDTEERKWHYITISQWLIYLP